MYYCMTGRSIWGNILLEIDRISPIEGRDDTEVENGILPDPRNCNNIGTGNNERHYRQGK